ncbi:MAG: hypothetical protein HWD85_06600 [Flavobacteriaceae bacterium]|nr:hypothetical protein [Flavobacteriaceae bacterium]
MKRLLLLFFITLFISCNNSKNSPEFISTFSGNYLFNTNEIISVYFTDSQLFVKWRGTKDIKPLKVNDSTFYLREMNEKFIFVTKPTTYIKLAEKREHKGNTIYFSKLEEGQKTPKEYFDNEQYDKALEGYLLVKKNNPNSRSIREDDINLKGYRALRKNNHNKAIEIFKMNVALHPKSANVYDSLGEAYWASRDTTNAVNCFKKVLTLDADNKRAKQFLKNYTLD